MTKPGAAPPEPNPGGHSHTAPALTNETAERLTRSIDRLTNIVEVNASVAYKQMEAVKDLTGIAESLFLSLKGQAPKAEADPEETPDEPAIETDGAKAA